MKMKGLLFWALCLALFSCNSNRLTEKVINTYSNRQPAKVYCYDQQGVWVLEKDYYDNGALMIEGPIADNLRNGDWTSYFLDGKVQSTGTFKDGKRVGPSKVYHENGQLWMDGRYHNDRKCGEWIFYDEQGYEIERKNYGPCE